MGNTSHDGKTVETAVANGIVKAFLVVLLVVCVIWFAVAPPDAVLRLWD